MADRKRAVRAAIRCGAALGAAVFAAAAHASFHTFQIDELYSSPDGLVQFVELHEFLGADGQEFLAGHALTSKQGATTRTYTFPSNLPNPFTAGKRVLIATPGFAALGVVTPDYVVPAPFLFPNGGTLDYAGVDSVTYPTLPGGVNSLSRSGAVGMNSPTNYAGQTGSILPAPPPLSTPVAGIPALARPLLAVLAALLIVTAVVTRRRAR